MSSVDRGYAKVSQSGELPELREPISVPEVDKSTDRGGSAGRKRVCICVFAVYLIIVRPFFSMDRSNWKGSVRPVGNEGEKAICPQ